MLLRERTRVRIPVASEKVWAVNCFDLGKKDSVGNCKTLKKVPIKVEKSQKIVAPSGDYTITGHRTQKNFGSTGIECGPMFTGKKVHTEGFPKGVNSSKTCLYRPG